MSEWWTYRLHDFLMFSPAAYWRLFEMINRALWPWQVLIAGFAILLAAAWRWPAARRGVTLSLAMAWAAVALAYFQQHYASIHWAGESIAIAFLVQAFLLVLVAVNPAVQQRRVPAGWWLIGAALFVHPLAAVLQGRPWQQAELFAIAPDPTALATIGWLLAHAPAAGSRWLGAALWPLPLLWCLYSSVTLWTMDEAQAAWLPMLIAAALAASGFGRRH